MCYIQNEAAIPKGWIQLDSQSTVDEFSNKKFLTNIHVAKRSLALCCNDRKAIITNSGDMKDYGTVWFHPEGIANLLSLSVVPKT